MEREVLHFSLDDAEGGMLSVRATVHQKVNVRVKAECSARQRANYPRGNSGSFQSGQGGNRARGRQGQPMTFPLRHQCFDTRCRHDLLTCPALRRKPYLCLRAAIRKACKVTPNRTFRAWLSEAF